MYIKIAICDDEKTQTEYLHEIVRKWTESNRFDVQVYTFSSAETFMDAYNEDNDKFNILLLDINMEGKSGMELAAEIRKKDSRLMIVFITGIPDFIAEGYDVSALHYLLKPVSFEKLSSVLDKAAVSLIRDAEKAMAVVKTVLLTSDGEDVKVSDEEIMFIESFDHICEITTVKEKLSVKMPISELEKKFSGSLIRCHRSYLVNLRYVKKMTKTEITLDNGITVLLSRRLYQDVSKSLLRYISEVKDR